MKNYIDKRTQCPFIRIELKKIRRNSETIKEICSNKGIQLSAVTKCFCADENIVRVMIKAGIDSFADSRVKNLKRLEKFDVEKMLIRIPMISEAEEVVRYADCSMNSSWQAVAFLGKEAVKQKKTHKIILMIDIGDLREGCLPENAMEEARKIIEIDGVELVGVGANYGCFGGVMPEYNNLKILVDIAQKIEEKLGCNIKIISGGNSFTYTNLAEGTLPTGINHFRFGDLFLTGLDSRRNKMVPKAYDDAITLTGEVIEVKDKPSKPYGTIDKNAFGEVPYFEDGGVRRRAIIAIGRQDIRVEDLIPIEKGIKILGASSDHLILDVEDCEKSLIIGDVVEFHMLYGAILATFTSEYVNKEYINYQQ
jgi:predicted amino acid racemase